MTSGALAARLAVPRSSQTVLVIDDEADLFCARQPDKPPPRARAVRIVVVRAGPTRGSQR